MKVTVLFTKQVNCYFVLIILIVIQQLLLNLVSFVKKILQRVQKVEIKVQCEYL